MEICADGDREEEDNPLKIWQLRRNILSLPQNSVPDNTIGTPKSVPRQHHLPLVVTIPGGGAFLRPLQKVCCNLSLLYDEISTMYYDVCVAGGMQHATGG